ncbi:putative crinkler family protein [Gigaspora margarita]|uniref:Putative crinkler family protein n=1 Tax=Gigaspora margarita TaxID=4874 RepID=A0A8H3X2L5_GIGMA|nr:putative crinkler family protein [Gigaspora margarita]
MRLDEDSPIFKFWKDFQNIEIDKKIISLTGGVYLLGGIEEESNIFVRQCYSDLSKIIFDSDKSDNFYITGTPGIGKSFFIYNLLIQLIKKGISVAYDRVNQVPILFHQGNVFKKTLVQFKNELKDSNVWYLVDGKHPMRYEAKTILVTSPQKENYQNFQKQANTKKYYMPVWTWDEPRHCLKKMEAAIGTCDLDMIVRIIGDVVDHRLEVNNKVVHIYANVPDEEPNNADMDVYKEHDNDNTMDICKDN